MLIQGRPKSVFQSKLIQCQVIVFVVCFQLDFIFATNEFITKSIGDLWGWFYFVSSILIFIVILCLMHRSNSTLSMPDAIEQGSVTKTYTPLMMTGILLFTLFFSGVAALSATKLILDLTIKLTSSTATQFKTKVDFEYESHSRRGGCNGIEYSFNNPPVQTDTLLCDRDRVLYGVKKGDSILVHEKMSFAGAHFISAERISS